MCQCVQQGAPPAFCREAEECGVPGLILHKEFVTEEEELQLLEHLKSPDVEWEWHTGRRVAHYGVPFDYAVRSRDCASKRGMGLRLCVDEEHCTFRGSSAVSRMRAADC